MKAKTMAFVLAGFLAGVAFVISCGEEARSIAQAVIGAVEVSFDNSGTDITATDVQGLGLELVGRVAALEESVGELPEPTPDLSASVGLLDTRVSVLEAATIQMQGMMIQLANMIAGIETLDPLVIERLMEEFSCLPPVAEWVVLDEQTRANRQITLDLSEPMSLRYLKVAVSYTDDLGQANVYEIEVFGPDDPTINLALGKTATSNSNEGDDPTLPGHAIDGTSTRWSSNRSNPGPASVEVPHWVEVDLGQNYRINKILIDVGDYNQNYVLTGKRGE